MAQHNRRLSSALSLIKRFVDDWLMEHNDTEGGDLVALIAALETLKEEAQHKLSEQTATSMQPCLRTRSSGGRKVIQPRQPGRTSRANEGLRRSVRHLRTTPRNTSTLFVPENETDAESDHIEHQSSSHLLQRSHSDNDSGNAVSNAAPSEQPSQSLADGQDAQSDNENDNNPEERGTITQSEEHQQNFTEQLPLSTTEPSDTWIGGDDILGDYDPGYFTEAFEAGYQEESTGIDGGGNMEGLEYERRNSPPIEEQCDGVSHEGHKDQTPPMLEEDGELPQHYNEIFGSMLPDPISYDSDADQALPMLEESIESPQRFNHISEATLPDRNFQESHTVQTSPMPEVSAELPQQFNDLFEDLYHDDGAYERHTNQAPSLPEEGVESPRHVNQLSATLYHEGSTSDVRVRRPQSFAEEPAFKEYLELARRSNFRLPHEPNHLEVPDLLLPLVEEVPLTIKLLHGLLYALLPTSPRVVEVCFDNVHDELLPKDENFAAIVHWTGESQLLLVLGDIKLQTLFILGGEAVGPPVLQAFLSQYSQWDIEYIDPDMIGPHIERTLLSVFIAEACFRHLLPITEVPSSRDLRLRFLGELLAPYERDAVLEQCGIPSNSIPSQKVDTRVIVPQPAAQVLANDDSFPNLANFNMAALRTAFLRKPVDISTVQSLRILQCVNEIGSPNILDSLKLALAKPPEHRVAQDVDGPIVEKLFHIHVYLDAHESRGHLLVARHRYIKFCYFETYQLAVQALQKEKSRSNKEQHKVNAFKFSESYKQGFRNELPDTPHTDNIESVYGDLSDDSRKKRAPDVVKASILRKVMNATKGNKDRIKRNIIRYIREGKVLHLILYGSVCLNPGLFILFPSQETHKPSLDVEQFRFDLEEAEKKSLSKPIGIKDVDGLTLVEATWFGEILQARPALLEQVPSNVLSIISDSIEDYVDLQDRDPERFKDKPLKFFI